MSFTDKIPMHYRESFFRDPFFADCWNILDKSATMTERHSSTKSERHSESSTRSSSSQEEHHRESEERQSPKPPSSETPSHGMSKVVNDPDKFQVFVEVENFAPEELVVKTVDHYVVVEGKHEEKKEPHGFISRQFTRKYLLPIDCKPENVSCNLSADGILVISVPKENIDLLPLKETIIEISKTDKKLKEDPKNPTAAA